MRSIEQLCALCVFSGFLVAFMLISIPKSDSFWQITDILADPSLSQYNNCIIPYVVKGAISEQLDAERITLVIHASFDRIGADLAVQVNSWDGPVSLAIVFPEEKRHGTMDYYTACTVQKLYSLRESHPKIAERLSAHFLFSHRKSADCLRVNASLQNESNFLTDEVCAGALRETDKSEMLNSMTNYPINLARNIARILTKTKYILLADLDHIFSEHFESKMVKLAQKELTINPKLALVYRIFEIKNEVTVIPRTKMDLLKLYKAKEAFEFHKDYFAHKIPFLNPWFEGNETKSDDAATIQFVRPYNHFAWEPQFVSLRTIPLYDESFSYPIRDNTVLRWEMCRAGYEFAIVNDVFMFHRGIKTKKENALVTMAKKRIVGKTKASIHGFNKRMDEHYPLTKNKCPKFKV